MNRSLSVQLWVLIMLLVFSDFFSLLVLKDSMLYIQWALVVWMLCYVILGLSPEQLQKPELKNYVLLFMLVPWLSIIPGHISHGQSLYQGVFALSTFSLVFVVYFVLQKLQMPENDLLKMMLGLAVIYTFLELIQQLSYPDYWFAGREKLETTGDLEVRLGLYKFYMTGIHLVILTVFYAWDKVLHKFSLKWLLLFLTLSLGIYAFLARKMDFAFLLCIACSFFIGKGIKWYYWIAVVALFVFLSLNTKLVFGDFVEQTKTELSSEDFIRFRATAFYMGYFDDPLCLWLGNGKVYWNSQYGRYIKSVQDNLLFYRSDIGIVAHLSYYGIIGCIPVLLFSVFLMRKWSKIPLYLKMYFIFHGSMFVMAFPLNSISGAFTFAIALYLMELNLQSSAVVVPSVQKQQKFIDFSTIGQPFINQLN